MYVRHRNLSSTTGIISKENTLLLSHISDTWYKATYIHNEIKFIEHLFPACHEETEVRNLEIMYTCPTPKWNFLCLDTFVTVLFFLRTFLLIIHSVLSKVIRNSACWLVLHVHVCIIKKKSIHVWPNICGHASWARPPKRVVLLHFLLSWCHYSVISFEVYKLSPHTWYHFKGDLLCYIHVKWH